MTTSLAALAQHARAELGHAVVGHEEALETLFLTVVCARGADAGAHVLRPLSPGAVYARPDARRHHRVDRVERRDQ